MKYQSLNKKFKYAALGCALLFAFGLMAGCTGSNGPAAPTTGTVTGTVTTATGGVPLAGVTVSSNPSIGTTATTDSGGHYTLVLPAGSYTITYTLTNFTSATASASVNAGSTTQTNASMAEAASGKPSVTVTANQNVGYGQQFAVTATATSPISGVNFTYAWTGINGTSTVNTATATSVSFATAMGGVAAPASDPGSYVSPFIQENSFGVLPINDDTRGQKTVKVTVNDGQGGSNSASVTVFSAGVQGGVKAVAVGLPVYMNSGIASDQTTTDVSGWTLVTPSSTSTATLSTAGTSARNPWFVPDVVGQYVVTSSSGTVMNIYAGTYSGAITAASTTAGNYTTKTFSKTDPKAGMWFDTTAATWWGAGQTSATYTNWPVVTPDQGCLFCHNDSTAPDNFTPWAQTAHATFFARGLEGITSNNGTCVKCHTVGWDQSAAAANGGYDDMATSSGFIYNKGVGAWATMWANNTGAARVTNIQCESCHGPQNTGGSYPAGAHKSTNDGVSDPTGTQALRIKYSSEVCAVCHSSGTHHHNYSEWNTLDPVTVYGHSNRATAVAEGMSTSCARCHSAQGYTIYLSQLQAGNIGSLSGSAIDWDATTVEPQTCTACHDPHSDANPNQLRVYNSTPLLPSGFSVDGLGKGALCVTCHNSRNGAETGSTTKTYLHEDNQPASDGTLNYNGGNPTGYSAPHQACQGDVLMGRNAYFMGASLPMISKHANAEDSCVACHMDLNPQTHGGAVSTHVWYILDQDKATVCANCHSSTVDGEALVTSVENLLSQLGNKLAASMLNKIQTAQAGTTVYYTDGNTGATGSLGTVTSVTVEEIHGQIGFQVNDGIVHDIQLGKFTTGSPTGTAIVPLTDPIVKAGWNYFLIEGDSSKGIHNPSFVTGVLNNTIGTNF